MRVAVALALAAATFAAAAPAGADTFAPGSLVIPMDTTYQDAGMLKAYGLVYELLRNGVPVRWVILPGKSIGQADFTASAKDHRTNVVVTSHGYRGGPFVVDAADAATAIPIVDKWQTANPAVVVHEATSAFAGAVARYLVAAPKIAMHADGNQKIAVSYLTAAGIPDSTLDYTWGATSPDLLTPAAVAGATTTNHHDGALFDADGDPVYCQFMSMHWAVKDAEKSPETVAEVRSFLTHPVHFFAECQAVDAFENLVPYGHFLTPNGYLVKAQPSSVDYYAADQTFAQIDGAFGTTGGSEPAFALPAGDSYKAGGVTMITAHGAAPGTWDLWMTGYLDGACPPNVDRCGSYGKVSYLGGHEYDTKLPISTNPKTQGVRLFLNSLFDSTCASAGGLPAISLVKSAPALTTSPTVTFTLSYGNAGPSVALNAVLSDPIPSGSTFVSATSGGTFANGKVSWNLGNLGDGETGSVSFTVALGAHATYANTAKLDYHVGLNPFSASSNTTSTLYDVDADGDGIADSVDDCPNTYDPMQDVQSDPESCGTCGHVCSAPHGQAGCSSGQCTVAGCDAGFFDCNGAVADGCEYPSANLQLDPANCGSCGKVCDLANATAACANGTCTVGTCDAGHSDCDLMPADGCEYADTGFATDIDNCGGCGVVCTAGLECKSGTCVVSSCPSGFADCNELAGDGCEYATSGFATDLANCGGCGKACAPANAAGACVAGKCAVASCSAGFADCDGLAGDGCEYATSGFATDPANCGGCGNVCAPANANGACVAGACAIVTCAAGFADCDGVAANGCEYATSGFASDPAHCGGCGTACSVANGTPACTAGACGIAACDPGHLDLDGDAANGCEYACAPVAATDVTCDGIDDDCNGAIDDGYVPVSCGVGSCTATTICNAGAEICPASTPSTEGPAGDPTCSDEIDNDCNGLTDDEDTACVAADDAGAPDASDGDGASDASDGDGASDASDGDGASDASDDGAMTDAADEPSAEAGGDDGAVDADDEGSADAGTQDGALDDGATDGGVEATDDGAAGAGAGGDAGAGGGAGSGGKVDAGSGGKAGTGGGAADDAGAAGASATDATADAGDTGSCGCRVPGAPERSTNGGLVMLAIAALAVRRRRGVGRSTTHRGGR